MKYVGHLIAHDVRRHRLLLVAWALTVVLANAIDGFGPMFQLDAKSEHLVGFLRGLLSLLHVLLMVITVSLLFHKHPAVGSDAFWLTRPIPVGAVLTAKALIVAIAFVLLPAVCETVLMVTYSVPARTLIGITAYSALQNVLWVSLLGALSALTRNLVALLLLIGGIVASFVLFVVVTLALTLRHTEDRPPNAGTWSVDDPTGFMILLLLTAGAAVALAIVQYRTRSRWRSVASGAVGVSVACLLAAVWPFPIWAHRLKVPEWVNAPSTLQLGVHSDEITFVSEPRPPEQPPKWQTARAAVSVGDVEAGWDPHVGVRHAQVRFADGRRLLSTIHAYPSRAFVTSRDETDEGFDNSAQTRRLLGVADLYPRWREQTKTWNVLMFVREGEFRPVVNRLGAYRGTFQVRLSHQTIEAALPLRAGADHRRGAYRFMILRVVSDRGGLVVVARESGARSVFGRRPAPFVEYFARNVGARQAIRGNPLHGEVAVPVFPLAQWSVSTQATGYGFFTRRTRLHFDPKDGERLAFSVDDAWLANAELVVTETTMEGAVERTLDIPNFPVREDPNSRSGDSMLSFGME
jgi:hypothetical protein